jgi:hypothetical protein
MSDAFEPLPEDDSHAFARAAMEGSTVPARASVVDRSATQPGAQPVGPAGRLLRTADHSQHRRLEHSRPV